jgi:diguanylate cyclase (GGDEF)-like protein/PAS domain S-box-containing protein
MPTKQLQHWFSILTDNSPSFFAVIDKKHNYLVVNDRYSEVSGLSKDELIGRCDRDVLGDNYYEVLKEFYVRAFKGESIEAEVNIESRNFETSLHFSVTPLSKESDIEGVLFHAIDISEQQVLLNSLNESENKFLKLTSLLTDGLFLLEDDIILSANPASAELLGFKNANEFIGEELHTLLIDENSNQPLGMRIRELSEDEELYCITGPKCLAKRRIRLTAQNTHVLGSNAKIVLISEALEDHLPSSHTEQFVMLDPLTGLYNRQGFSHRIEHHIENDIPFVMLYLDIDNFKNINDSLGHHVGDKVLKDISNRLRRLLPKEATLGHLSGDEFAIISPEPENEQVSQTLSKQIIELINQPFDLHHFSKRLACSIGSVNFPGDGTDARILLQNADTAMYEAKERGRNRMIHFDDQMNKKARMRLWLEIELQKALQNQGLEVWYQPKVNARNFTINGAEALVRWKHPVEGYISPAQFIPVAESSGMIEQVGKVVMREVFTTVNRWTLQGIIPGRIAINLSPQQFGSPHLIEYMSKLLTSTGVDPALITFELTESAVMSDSVHTIQMLNAIKKLGFALSIDDFGTGYSSLSYLARFPLDEIKIDRKFIMEIDTLPKQIAIIENIINLGKTLSMQVVAEGVETRQQATLLSNLNCDTIQGFHFYKPQPKEEIEAIFIDSSRRKVRGHK